MSRARENEVSSPISLFPFIGILLCTMGALLVVLVAVSRSARDTAEGEIKAKSAANAEADAGMKSKLSDVQQYVGKLGTIRGGAEKMLRDEHARLSHVEEHIRRLHDQLRSLQLAAEELEGLEREHYDDRAQAERETARINQLIEDSRKQIESLQEEETKEASSYALVPYEGPNGTFRRPIYIECVADGLILQPEGVRISRDDLRPPVTAGNPLASALRAMRDHYVKLHPKEGVGRDHEPYPLLIVRPDGLYMFDKARQAVEAGDFDLGFELVEADWKLKYPQADPQLVVIEQQVIEQARARQEVLAAAAPRAYRGGAYSFDDRYSGDDEGDDDGGEGYGEGGGYGGSGGGGGGFGGGSSGGGGGGSYSGGGGNGGGGGTPGGGLSNGGGGAGGGSYAGAGGAAGSGNGGPGGGSGGGPGGGGGAGGGNGGGSYAGPGGGNAGGGYSGGGGSGGGGSGGGAPGGSPGDGSFAGGSPAGGGGGSAGGMSSGGGAAGQGGAMAGGGAAGGSNSGGGGGGSSGMTAAATTDPNSPDANPNGVSMMVGSPPPDAYQPGNYNENSSAARSNIPPEQRGKDWALRGKPQKAMPVRRTIRVTVTQNQLVVGNQTSQQSPAGGKAIPFKGDTVLSIDDFVKQVHGQIDGWGMAGNNLYWRPVIVLSIAPDGQKRAADLTRLLRNSGLDIRTDETASNAPAGGTK